MLRSVLLYLLVLVACSLAFRTQSVAVKGRLLCGTRPATGVLLKLVDEDDGPDPDDSMDQAKTGDDGIFSLSGSANELTPIDPEVRIYHDCNDHGKPCKRRWKIRIPSKYIYNGDQAEEPMDLGTINLKMMRPAFLLLTLISAVVALEVPQHNSGKQGYRVKGVLMCGKSPAKDVRVKLVDDDFGPDQDDDLDTGYTDTKGFFELAGFTTELTTIDPQLKIYHDCNDGITPCQRRWKFELPNEYIRKGSDSPEVFDIGTWNLEALLPGESRDCLH